jgi:hypothetical protein
MKKAPKGRKTRRTWRDDPVTLKQIKLLAEWGIERAVAIRLTKGQASDLIGEHLLNQKFRRMGWL